jgi:helix-turn-helix protein
MVLCGLHPPDDACALCTQGCEQNRRLHHRPRYFRITLRPWSYLPVKKDGLLRCEAEPACASARFCTKCGAALKSVDAVAPNSRRRWLASASGPDSPIDHVAGLSDDARRVYRYLADVTLRFGSSHSRIATIAHVAGLSEHKAREAIRELERRGLLSHRCRNTWHGRGAHSYYVRRIDASRLLGPYTYMERRSPFAPDGDWLRRTLQSESFTIAGGTSWVQKNMIGERILQLPKG